MLVRNSAFSLLNPNLIIDWLRPYASMFHREIFLQHNFACSRKEFNLKLAESKLKNWGKTHKKKKSKVFSHEELFKFCSTYVSFSIAMHF